MNMFEGGAPAIVCIEIGGCSAIIIADIKTGKLAAVFTLVHAGVGTPCYTDLHSFFQHHVYDPAACRSLIFLPPCFT